MTKAEEIAAHVAECALLEEVRVRKFLYDKKSKEYKDSTAQMNGWKSIAITLGANLKLTPDAPNNYKNQWTGLARQYTTYLRKLVPPTGADVDTWIPPTFRHSAIMEWYKRYYTPYKKKTITNFQSPPPSVSPESTILPDQEDDDSSSLSSESEVSERIVINFIKKGPQKKNILMKRKQSDVNTKILNVFKKKPAQDKYFHFGMQVADQLRDLDREKGASLALDCELIILQTLKDANN